MGCFPGDFQEGKRPIKADTAKRPIKVGSRPFNDGKRPIKAMVLVGVQLTAKSLMGCFWARRPWWKPVPLKRPIMRGLDFTLGVFSRKLSSYKIWLLLSPCLTALLGNPAQLPRLSLHARRSLCLAQLGLRFSLQRRPRSKKQAYTTIRKAWITKLIPLDF